MLRLMKVSGRSLEPDFFDGDYVLAASYRWCFKQPRPGDTVIFHHPSYGTLIKKIESIDSPDGRLKVVGTHVFSVDSRDFGPVARSQLIGRVIWHIRRS